MKNFTLIACNVLLIYCFSSFNANPTINRNYVGIVKQQVGTYSKDQIEKFIREVFAEKADELVLKSTTKRIQLITDFLNRVTIEDASKYKEKELPLLSSFDLKNMYNPNLKRDVVFDPKTFNPLKYNLKMDEKRKSVIRVDGSNFVICIQPINQ